MPVNAGNPCFWRFDGEKAEEPLPYGRKQRFISELRHTITLVFAPRFVLK